MMLLLLYEGTARVQNIVGSSLPTIETYFPWIIRIKVDVAMATCVEMNLCKWFFTKHLQN